MLGDLEFLSPKNRSLHFRQDLFRSFQNQVSYGAHDVGDFLFNCLENVSNILLRVSSEYPYLLKVTIFSNRSFKGELGQTAWEHRTAYRL